MAWFPRWRARAPKWRHTIAFRRRKGTATMLEQLARDVTGWPARVVEMFQLLGWTQHMNHIRPESRYAPDLRQWEKLERLNTPFDSLCPYRRRARHRQGTGQVQYSQHRRLSLALAGLSSTRLAGGAGGARR